MLARECSLQQRASVLRMSARRCHQRLLKENTRGSFGICKISRERARSSATGWKRRAVCGLEFCDAIIQILVFTSRASGVYHGAALSLRGARLFEGHTPKRMQVRTWALAREAKPRHLHSDLRFANCLTSGTCTFQRQPRICRPVPRVHRDNGCCTPGMPALTEELWCVASSAN